MSNQWKAFAFAIATLIVAAGAQAQSIPAGAGTLLGAQRIKASGCGKETDAVSVDFSLAANGAWTLEAGDEDYSGTSSISGRTATLTPDAGSLTELDAFLEDEASSLCDDDIAINSLSVTSAKLKGNKRGTAVKLQIKVAATGTSSEGAGRGSFRLKAAGIWQAAQ